MTSVNILLVDDRPENLMALEAVLSNPEYHLVKAGSGEEALKHLLREDFAVILLDVQMPGLDGFETAMLIKKREKSQEIPILFITALHQEEMHSKRGYEIGGVDYIFKPFDPNALRSKIAVFVNLYRKGAQIQKRAEEFLDAELRKRERRLAELEVETQARFELLAEAIPQIVFTAAGNGQIEYFNQRWYDFTGISPSSSHGLGWQSALHPEDVRRTQESWAEVARTSQPSFEIEHRFRNRKGDVHWHLTRASALRNSEGVTVKWFGTSTDIEEQKQTERELKRSQDRLQVAMDAAFMATWEWDHGSDKIVRSENFDRLFGLVQPLPKSDWADFRQRIHSEDREAVDAWMIEAYQQSASYSAEFRVLWPDDSQHWLAARGRARINEHNQVVGLAGAVIDIDILKKTESQLQNAVQAREEILAVVSHDLKNPLGAIQLNAQMAQRLSPTERVERLERHLERIVSSAERAIRLIHDLLDLAQIESGHLPILPETTDLAELVRRETEYLDPVAALKGLKLTALVPAAGLTVQCDPKRMLQVLSNLIGNAIKFTPPGGEIEVSVCEGPEEIRLVVRDTGPGIDRAHSLRLFDRYWQARQQKGSSPTTGTGLGLYIAKGIVEGHGGRIQVQSELGSGAVFEVLLPRRRQESVA